MARSSTTPAAPAPAAVLAALLACLTCAAAPAEAHRWWVPPPVLNAAQEVANLTTYLNGNGYVSLATAIDTFGLATTLEATLNATKGLTILAPNDTAFASFDYQAGAACEPSMQFILGQHVLPIKISPSAIFFGSNTLTPVPVYTAWRGRNVPLTVVVLDGRGATVYSANVTQKSVYSTKYVLVHQISNVLRYPSGTTCPSEE